jgi:hypothetical protein
MTESEALDLLREWGKMMVTEDNRDALRALEATGLVAIARDIDKPRRPRRPGIFSQMVAVRYVATLAVS